MSDNKLTPEARDKLAQKLRSNLGRSRPRPWLWALGGLLATGFVLWVLWKGSQPPPPSPPLLLTAFDALVGDVLEAQLTAPGHPDAKLEGLTAHWKVSERLGNTKEADTKTDANGFARLRDVQPRPWGKGRPDLFVGTMTIDVWYIDPTDKSRRRDARATLLTYSTDNYVLVSIDDLVGKNTDWRKPGELPVPVLPKGKGIACAAGPVDAETYRAIQSWLTSHAPNAIVLRKTAEELENRLTRWRP